MTDNNNIEKLFKDTFDNFEPNVDASVWNGVEQGIKNVPATPASAVVKSFSALKSVIAVVSVATIAVVTYSILKTKSPEAIVAPLSNMQTTIEKNNFNAGNKVNAQSENNTGTLQTLTEAKPKQALPSEKNNSENVVSENSTLTNSPSSTTENSNTDAPSGSAQSTAGQQNQTQPEQTPEQSTAEPAETKEGTPVVSASQTCNLNLSNTFTPNGDGINDTYFIEDNNLAELHVKVLDLRGNILKQWNNTSGNWDGKFANNADAPNGTYLLIVNAVCNNGEAFSKKIQIRLIRQ